MDSDASSALQGFGALALLLVILFHIRCVMLNAEAPQSRSEPQGSDLIDPAHAQHAQTIRMPGFIDSNEIQLIRAVVARHRMCHPHAGGTLYLQHEGLDRLLAPIVSRIHDQVKLVDAELWGLNAVAALEGVSGLSSSPGDTSDASDTSSASASYCTDGSMRPRTIEFHEYSERGRKACGSHCDHGSLFTADVMLSNSSDFEGGRMMTTVAEEGVVPVHTTHAFEQGDLLVFPAHKPHSVGLVTTGTRQVFVVEFWRGPACTCDCRCMGACAHNAGVKRRAG